MQNCFCCVNSKTLNDNNKWFSVKRTICFNVELRCHRPFCIFPTNPRLMCWVTPCHCTFYIWKYTKSCARNSVRITDLAPGLFVMAGRRPRNNSAPGGKKKQKPSETLRLKASKPGGDESKDCEDINSHDSLWSSLLTGRIERQRETPRLQTLTNQHQ